MPLDALDDARDALDRSRWDDALRLAQEAGEAATDVAALYDAHRLAARAAFSMGDGDTARRHGFTALRFAGDLGGRERARAHNDLAVLFGAHGMLQHALDHLWQAIHAAEAAGGEAEGGPLNNLGNVYLDLRRSEEAVALFERARARFAAAGDEPGATIALANLGRAHALAGRGSQAIPALDAALGTFERLGRLDDVVATLAKLGVAHGAAGRPVRAARAFERALAMHEAGHAARLERETRQWYGEWALRQEDVDTALRQLQASADAHPGPDDLARSGVLEPLSRALEAAGRVPEALATLRRHTALDAERRRAAADAAARVRLLELELGLHGDQEISRLHAVKLEKTNADLRRQAAQFEELSTTDGLTGLRNRRALESRAREEIAAARRYGRPLVLALVDLDRFKWVNDTFSHEMGDRVLKRVASLLRRNLRASDVAARWGGEEFALLLPGLGVADADAILERLRGAIAREPWERVVPGLAVTTSIGAAGLEEADDLEGMLRLADRRLYAAKDDGRDRIVAADSA